MTNASHPDTVFTLTIDGQEMTVRYWPYCIDGLDPYAVLEFISPHQPRRCIPVSATGYRTFFAPMAEVESAPSIEKYVWMVALVLAAESSPRARNADQLKLS